MPVYVDKDADLEMAEAIILNAKCQRPGVCNAAESLVVHKAVADRFIPVVAEPAGSRRGVVMVGDDSGAQVVRRDTPGHGRRLGHRIPGVETVGQDGRRPGEAINHINTYGSGHSEAIITGDYAAARRFTSEVDAAAVYVNASTRFTDGGQYGLGAEIGISTQKLHVRGPMGLEALTSHQIRCLGTAKPVLAQNFNCDKSNKYSQLDIFCRSVIIVICC